MKILADENIPKAKQLFSPHGQFKTYTGRGLSVEDLEGVDALLVRSITPVNQRLLANSGVKFVGTATIGTDHVDLDWLSNTEIGFANAPGCNAISVAEYVLSGLFVLSAECGIDLRTITIGIVGAGNVGSALASRLAILGIPHGIYDPPLASQGDPRHMLSESELAKCDILTFHVPLTHPEQSQWPTHHMVNADFLAAMPKLKYLINSSRGSVVNTPDLKDWLKADTSRQAIMDVWENEPTIDIELLDLCLVGTPHIAGHSYEGKVRGTLMLYRAFCEFFDIEYVLDSESLMADHLPKDVITLKQDLNYMQAMSSALWGVYKICDDDKALRAGIVRNMAKHFDGLRKGYKIRRECTAHRLDETSAPDGAIKTLKQLGFKV